MAERLLTQVCDGDVGHARGHAAHAAHGALRDVAVTIGVVDLHQDTLRQERHILYTHTV